jgi:hypothetical protein
MGFVFFRHGQGWKKSYPAKVNPKNIIYFFHITQSFFSKKIITPFAIKRQLGNEGALIAYLSAEPKDARIH